MAIVDYLEGEDTDKALHVPLFQQVQDDILAGTLRPGERLTESSICEKYGVSRSPVRETLSLLEADGLIKTVKNKGAVIIGISQDTLDDVELISASYEILASGLAAERMDDTDKADLNEIFEFMEYYTLKGDIERMNNINMAFHKIIYHSSHDTIIERELTRFQYYIMKMDPPVSDRPGYLEQILEEHKKIYDAIMSGDRRSAQDAMNEHMLREKARRMN